MRQDYQKRLDAVVEELKGHTTKLHESLGSQKHLRVELGNKEQAVGERLAEAEVRHAVGEYDESKYTAIRSETKGELAKIRQKMKAADAEIASLEEVLVLIEMPEPGGGGGGGAIPAAPAMEDEEAAVPESPTPVGGSSSSKPRKSGSLKQTDAFDELAFLKSVTDDEKQGPRPSRASGSHVVHGAQPVPRAEEADPPLVTPPEESATSALGSSGPRPVTTKTLKCSECGAMNAPTEWYCEKCGAELAAL